MQNPPYPPALMDTRNISAPDYGNSPAFNNGAHYAQKNDAATTFQNFCKPLREFLPPTRHG